ncbi:MAG: DUF4258 domain-containing protein [Sulfurovum sp.]|nr:DUF4258 domain-containing protein [Sulfurovum sp.]
MKIIRWNEEKNIILREHRGVSFEDIEEAILNDRLHRIELHPDQEKYPNQKKLFVEIEDCIYVALFVENDDEIFFKTIYPSRKDTKLILGTKNKK